LEIVLEALSEYAEEAKKILKWAMEKAGKYFFTSIPMITEPVVGKVWGH